MKTTMTSPLSTKACPRSPRLDRITRSLVRRISPYIRKPHDRLSVEAECGEHCVNAVVHRGDVHVRWDIRWAGVVPAGVLDFHVELAGRQPRLDDRPGPCRISKHDEVLDRRLPGRNLARAGTRKRQHRGVKGAGAHLRTE